jgi:hypothetical protein
LPDRRWRDGSSSALAAAVVLALATLVAGCGGAAPSSAAPGTPNADPAATDSPLVVDAGLLQVLPTTVAGIAMQPSPETAAGMIDDAGLADSASAVAVGVVAGAGSSESDDFAVSTVVQLRPGVFSDPFYQAWRDDYDTAACEPSGGVESHSQRVIGPNTVEVTVCSEGARTYHTHLPGDRLVSITAVGDRNFGDLVMAGLRQ